MWASIVQILGMMLFVKDTKWLVWHCFSWKLPPAPVCKVTVFCIKWFLFSFDWNCWILGKKTLGLFSQGIETKSLPGYSLGDESWSRWTWGLEEASCPLWAGGREDCWLEWGGVVWLPAYSFLPHRFIGLHPWQALGWVLGIWHWAGQKMFW